MYPLSELTSKTFASGLETHGENPSLLHRLTNEVLVLKDLTTVLEMYQEERQAILAQLREIYDGRFDKAWGTGKELHWQGRLGFLAGVTPIIDSYHSVLSVLGERFVLFRNASATVRRALEDLQALGILEVVKGGAGKSDAWRPYVEWKPTLDTLKTVELRTTARAEATFSAKSPPPSHTQILNGPCQTCGKSTWRDIPGADQICRTCEQRSA